MSWLITAVGIVLSIWYLSIMLRSERDGRIIRVRYSLRKVRLHEKRALAASACLHTPFFQEKLLTPHWFAQAIWQQERREAQEKRNRHLWRVVKRQLMEMRYPQLSQPGPFL